MMVQNIRIFKVSLFGCFCLFVVVVLSTLQFLAGLSKECCYSTHPGISLGNIIPYSGQHEKDSETTLFCPELPELGSWQSA